MPFKYEHEIFIKFIKNQNLYPIQTLNLFVYRSFDVWNIGDEIMIDYANQTEIDLMNRKEPQKITEASLGKHWNSICSLRIQVERQHDVPDSKPISSMFEPRNRRIIRILKSNQYKNDTNCVVNLTNNGII